MNYEYVDHLKEYMKDKVARYVQTQRRALPVEFEGIPEDRLIEGIADHASAILRKIEDDAIEAAVERYAGLIRYSIRTKKERREL